MTTTPPAAAPAWSGTRRRPLGPLVLGLFALLGFTFCGGISEADVWCNEALAHLEQCCPAFNPAWYACDAPTFPLGCASYSFDVKRGQQLALMSCQALIEAGDCEAPPFAAPVGGAP